MTRFSTIRQFLFYATLVLAAAASAAEPMKNTAPLRHQNDFVAAMVEGIGHYLDKAATNIAQERTLHWQRDFSSPEAYAASIAANRRRLARYIGAVDTRESPQLRTLLVPGQSPHLAVSEEVQLTEVTWNIFRDVHAAGLLLEPVGTVHAQVIALPDGDWQPEQVAGLVEGTPAYALGLARAGCRVLVPTLIDRDDAFSGNPEIRMTNQPHREFLYRPAYQMGRHIIGYEVQKVLAAVDWLENQADLPVGLFGYGEGGLIAFYAAALDERITSTVVSGYFQPREALWSEPIYRNVWGLLHEFGDAEIASLVAPRTLIVEAARHPEISGPPAEREGRTGAAPGEIKTPPIRMVRREVERARELLGTLEHDIQLQIPKDGAPAGAETLLAFLASLGIEAPETTAVSTLALNRPLPDARSRMKAQFDQILEDTQEIVRRSPYVRAKFWENADASSLESWVESSRFYRDYFWNEVIGSLPEATEKLRARTRQIYDEPAYTGYEVTVPVFKDVFAYGILLLPKDIADGEKRPVVVCQHGLEGRPQEVADIHVESPYYHAYGAKLAQEGFIVFAPQNPYIGADEFRVLQRKANPLKVSLFSFIVRQHERILDWLKTLPQVDPERMAFYGLSYGGKTAMRVPAILDDYCLSICSGDFNEWIWKTTSSRSHYSYLFTGEYEMFEFDLGNTFNYAELAALIFPRPFMVERGHSDGVAPDEWVAYEFAKVRRHYDQFDLGGRTTIEFFNGPHMIYGVGTFEFLKEHLGHR